MKEHHKKAEGKYKYKGVLMLIFDTDAARKEHITICDEDWRRIKVVE